MEEIERLYPLYKEMGWPTCLKDLNLRDDETLLNPVIDKALANPDTKKPPFEVTRDLLWSAIRRLEQRGA
jgi:glycerol dehydrogenase